MSCPKQKLARLFRTIGALCGLARSMDLTDLTVTTSRFLFTIQAIPPASTEYSLASCSRIAMGCSGSDAINSLINSTEQLRRLRDTRCRSLLTLVRTLPDFSG